MKQYPHNSLPSNDEVYSSFVDLVYLVKINRISKGFSTEELSFLIGRAKNYIETRESLLPRKDFTMRDICWLAEAFGIVPPSLFMNNSGIPDKIRVRTSVVKQNGITYHITERIEENGEPQLFYQLYEYTEPTPDEIKRDQQQLDELIRTVGKLLHGKYFDKNIRRPLEIFQHCRSITKKDIRPRLLQKALDTHTASDKFPCLKKYWGKNAGYLYKKINRLTRKKRKK
jgi:transcriptional regulator with XRE-family HTH domain